MNNTIEAGCYNVSFCGLVYENDKKYEMVIIEKFEGEKYIQDSKKVFYFLDNKNTIIPKLETVEQIEKIYNSYFNNSRIKWEHVVKISLIHTIY